MIETISGRVTTSGRGSLDLSLYYRRDAASAERPLFVAEKDEKAEIKTIGQVEVIPAITNGNHGQYLWSKKRYNMPEGAFIKIVIRRDQIGGGVFKSKTGAIMLRYRSTAPLHQFAIDFPTDARSALSVGYIEGRFDVLSIKEVRELGLHKNRAGGNEAAMYERGNYEEYVSLREIEPAIAPHTKPTMAVQTPKAGGGKSVGVLRVKPKRRIATK